MTTAPPTPPMSAEQSAALAEFARACKSAARAVSLYPGAHPAIGGSLGRLVTATNRLLGGAETVLVVHPTGLVIDDRAPVRPDAAIVELADLLHGRLVGTLRVQPGADGEDWRAFLLLLARSVEDLIAEGGIGKAWAATGRSHFDIHEIDYAEVLRERKGTQGAAWDRVLAFCLKGEAVELDEGVISALLSAVETSEQFASLLDRLHERAEAEGASASARVGALMQLLKTVIAAKEQQQPGSKDEVLATVAQASPHLTPEMVLGLLSQRDSANSQDAGIARDVVDHMNDSTIAALVARSITVERSASERLAQVFEMLVPDAERKTSVLEQAKVEAWAGEFGADARFEEVWQGAVTMLSYSDKGFVSTDYARELSAARAQAIEVERLSEDPPERIAAWLATVSETAVREMDLILTLDLMRIEHDPKEWSTVASLTVGETERRTLTGDIAGAQQLAAALASTSIGDQPLLHQPAAEALTRLARGPLARHVVSQLKRASDADVALWTQLCQTVGPRMVLPFAEALSSEDHTHTIRRIREILIGFGAEGRQAVEPLKNSTNPAVRRTAVDLLRVFGGNEALKELTALLDDADPQVQRDAVRAIVQIATPEAFAVIDRACAASDGARELIAREMIALHDNRAVTPLSAVLKTTVPRGSLVALHEAIIEALGGMGSHAESTAALRGALDRGEWWAPKRTALLRKAAAAALKRIGSPESLAALQDAATNSNRGVRNAAKAALESAPAAKGGAR